MGRSGNPAKAALSRSLDDVKEAVRKGETLIVQPWPNTTVHINSTSESEATQVVIALQPLPEDYGRPHVDAYMHHTRLTYVYLASDSKYRAQIIRGLQATLEALQA